MKNHNTKQYHFTRINHATSIRQNFPFYHQTTVQPQDSVSDTKNIDLRFQAGQSQIVIPVTNKSVV